MMKIILIVASHPDDEVIGCGGTIAKHVASGDIVHVAFMTNGVGSRGSISINNDIKDRSLAAQSSADILGVSSIHNFDLEDNKMDSIPLLDIVKLIEGLIKEINPNVVYTHHIGDLNIDHRITHKALMTACRPIPGSSIKEIYTFEILSSTEWQTVGYSPFIPNVYIDVSKQIELKRKALYCYNEEMRKPPHSRSIENIIRLNNLRGNSIGIEYAEAFTLVRNIIA